MGMHASTVQRSRKSAARVSRGAPLLEALEPRLLMDGAPVLAASPAPTPAVVSDLARGVTFTRSYIPGQGSETFALTLTQGRLLVEKEATGSLQITYRVYDESHHLLTPDAVDYWRHWAGSTVYVEVTPQGTAPGSFQLSFRDWQAGEIGAADFNGDGLPETAFADDGQGFLKLRAPSGNITLWANVPGFKAKDWQVVDINSDGRPDLLNPLAPDLLLNTGSGPLYFHLGSWQGARTRAMADVQLLNLNADNWLDLAARDAGNGDWFAIISQPFIPRSYVYHITFLGRGTPGYMPVNLTDAAGQPRLADLGLQLTQTTTWTLRDYMGSRIASEPPAMWSFLLGMLQDNGWSHFSVASWEDVPRNLLGFTPPPGDGLGLAVTNRMILAYMTALIGGQTPDLGGATLWVTAAIQSDPHYQIYTRGLSLVTSGAFANARGSSLWNPNRAGTSFILPTYATLTASNEFDALDIASNVYDPVTVDNPDLELVRRIYRQPRQIVSLVRV